MKTLCQILLFVVTNFTNSYFFFLLQTQAIIRRRCISPLFFHSFSPKNENSSGLSATIKNSVVEIFVPL